MLYLAMQIEAIDECQMTISQEMMRAVSVVSIAREYN